MADLTYPKNIREGLDSPAWMQFNFYERRNARDPATAPLDRVCMYMPEAISQPSTVSWQPEKFGYVGQGIADGARASMQGYSGGGGARGAWDAGTASIMSHAEGAGDLALTRGLASGGSFLAQLGGGNVSAEGLMGSVAGKIPNPYLTMIFQGIDFRNFSFVFKFYPFEESDCTLIDQIIKTFRKNALPDYQDNNTFLGYPAECEISYMWDAGENPWIHRFKKSVCTAIDVDYTASGMFSVMRNGFPSEIIVSTKWTEIELVTREDVGDGF